MKARQNSDTDNKAYERDAKMTQATKGKGFWHYAQILGELALVMLFLISALLICLTIMQG
jgi:hypothetical protein